jgi:ferritin-like protein
MGQNSNTLHEDPEVLGPEVIDRHRAIASLMEELEAVDWYDQRVQACKDEDLKRILAHNRDEEKEHACMVLEWLRRHDPKLDEHLRTYLFSDGSILDREHAVEHGGGGSGVPSSEGPTTTGSLNLGSLRGKESQ